jgi:HEAT repeat protein
LAVNSNPRVRRNVALALGLLGEKSALTTILPTMRADADPVVRQQALEAMWRLGDEGALKDLVALTASGYADDQMRGLLALAAPQRQIVRGNVRSLLSGNVHKEVTLVAARAMGMLGSDEGYGIAMEAVKSQDPQQRFLAALALGAIGRTDAQDALRTLLADRQANVQLAAASAVLQLSRGTHSL